VLDGKPVGSGLRDAKKLGHFVVEKSLSGLVGLNPFSVENELRDGALAGIGDDLGGGTGRSFYIDLFEGDGVQVEKALGLAAIAAPVG
jgi:hypothetical protein